MKRFILSMLILVSVSCLEAQQLSDKFVKFRGFCLQSQEAFRKQSADSLASCVQLLFSMMDNQNESWVEWDKLTSQTPQDSSLYKGHLLIDVNWMDNLVEQLSGDAVPVDKSSRIRGKGLLYVNYLVSANSTQSFHSRGRGLMTIMVIPEDGTDIKVKIDQESCDHHYESESGLQDGCIYDVWQAQPLPNPLTPFTIQVTNPSDHDIICTFVTD